MRAASLAVVIAVLGAAGVRGADAKPDPSDEKLLTDAGLKHDRAGLLDFIRKRTGKDTDLERVPGLVAKLGDEKFATRWTASQDLRGIKPPESIAGQLRRLGLAHTDVEVRDQCRVLLRAIEKEATASPQLAAAAARLLRRGKPDGALAVLLAYLPYAPDEQAEDEVITALALLAIKDGKVDEAISAALKDTVPARKGLAAMFLGRSGTAEEKKPVAVLLEDKDSLLRLRAAQGLLAGHDKAAVPTLFALLTDSPLEQAIQAEDLLACLSAGRSGPRIPLGETEASRKKCREAWETWWKANDSKVDLAKLEVDLSPFNSTLRTRQTIRGFLLGFNRGDFNAVATLSDVPFHANPGPQHYTERQQVDSFWSNNLVSTQQQRLTLGAGSLVKLEDYLRTAPADEKQALADLQQDNYRALYVYTYINGQYAPNNAMWHALLLHVDGPQVRICGTGQGTR
jgi:hypothetical protein